MLEDARDPVISRDGALMAYFRYNKNFVQFALHVAAPDGSGDRELMPMVCFSPDGKQIVMMGAGGIYLMNPDGTNVRQIDTMGDHGGLDCARP
jgi:hypothetical protein